MIDTVELAHVVRHVMSEEYDAVSEHLATMVEGPAEAAQVILGVSKVTAVLIERRIFPAGTVKPPKDSTSTFAALVEIDGAEVTRAQRTAAQLVVALMNDDLPTAFALTAAAVEAGQDEAWALITAALIALGGQR